MTPRTDFRPAGQFKVVLGLLLMAILITGCKLSGSPNRRTLKITRTNVYRIAQKNTPLDLSSYFQPQGSENVYFLHPSTGSLHVLNTGNGTLRLAGIVPEPGEFDGFIIREEEQKLYLFSPDSVKVYNYHGDLTDAFPLPDAPNGYMYMSGGYFPPVAKNDKLYLSYFPRIEGAFRNPAYFTVPVEAELDLKTKKVTLSKQGYPAMYQHNCYSYHYDASRFTIGQDLHAFTFPHSDSVYLYNTETGERSTRFFGALVEKKVKYISFAQIPKLHETVFDDLVRKNPHYSFPTASPLAGYYSRELLLPPKKAGDASEERIVLFDKNLQYIGEAVFRPNILIDSKKGLLSMRMEQNNLLIDRLSW